MRGCWGWWPLSRRKRRRGQFAGGRRALNLLSFEYSDVDARKSCSACETRERSSPALHRGDGNLRSYRPGDGLEETKGCSIVTAVTVERRNGQPIGLIGPTRMQYGKVFRCSASRPSITELLDGQNESHENKKNKKIRARRRNRSGALPKRREA
ncbi:MAG: hypothetical protein ACLUI3_02155 [Christensenellales bacterium]